MTEKYEKNNKAMYTFEIEIETLEEIKEICKNNGYKIGGYINHLIEIGLENRNKS